MGLAMRNGSITLLLSLPRPGLEFGGLQGSELGRRRPPSGAGLCSRAPQARGVRIAAPHKGPPPSRAWGGAQAEGAQPPAPHLGAGAPALRCSLLASPTRRLATVFRSLWLCQRRLASSLLQRPEMGPLPSLSSIFP